MMINVFAFLMLWALTLGARFECESSPDLVHMSPRDEVSSALTGRGINCKGSSMCKCHHLAQLREMISTIDDSKTFGDRELLACTKCTPRGIMWCQGQCAFLQRMGSRRVSAGNLKSKLEELAAFGCKGCGSVPIFPGNNVDDGMLTVNFRNDIDDCCNMVCPRP